jgi:hypothetical protein
MKKAALIILAAVIISVSISTNCAAQCSICTKTAAQMGVKPAKGLNAGILYLMLTPLIVAGYIGMRWWKREKEVMAHEAQLA